MPYVEKLKMIRDERGLTNIDIARLGNVPLPTVTRVFNGQTPNPTFETIKGIAMGLGVSLDELAGLKHDAPNDKQIKVLIEEIKRQRKEKYIAVSFLIFFIIILLALLTVDIMNGHFGYFRY